MLWKNQRQSTNVIDQRHLGAKAIGGGGLILGAIVVYLMGGNPLVYLAQNVGSMSPQSAVTQSPEMEAADNERKGFVSAVLANTEDVWSELFRRQASQGYQAPEFVLFRGQVQSGCGGASSATGPFYCPADQRLYMDLSFLEELSGRLGARGDFAGAYVVAHEVGHHIQNLLGVDKGNGSVAVELQADCLAGVWAKQAGTTTNVLEEGDIDEALGAAAAVGDDRLQQQSQGYVVPDSFTHGTSEQRVAAFKQGYAGGELEACVRSR